MVKSEDGTLPHLLVRLESQLVCKKNGASCSDLELPKLHSTRSCIFFSFFAFERRVLTQTHRKECHEKHLEVFLSKPVLLSGQLWQYAKALRIIKNMARGWLKHFQ